MNIDDEIIIAENEYGKYAVPASTAHRSGSRELIEGIVHEPETIKLIMRERGNGIVVHAGAFIGDFLPALSGPDHRIFAFEPGALFFKCCQQTMQMNFPDGNHQTTLIKAGLGAEPAFDMPLLTMSTETESEGGTARILEHLGNVDERFYEPVEITTIDMILPQHHDVSIIHLDIEGFEERALMGGINTIRTSKPMLIIEAGMNEHFDSDFYQNVIFGELGYEDIGQTHGWNRILKPK